MKESLDEVLKKVSITTQVSYDESVGTWVAKIKVALPTENYNSYVLHPFFISNEVFFADNEPFFPNWSSDVSSDKSYMYKMYYISDMDVPTLNKEASDFVNRVMDELTYIAKHNYDMMIQVPEKEAKSYKFSIRGIPVIIETEISYVYENLEEAFKSDLKVTIKTPDANLTFNLCDRLWKFAREYSDSIAISSGRASELDLITTVVEDTQTKLYEEFFGINSFRSKSITAISEFAQDVEKEVISKVREYCKNQEEVR